MGEELSQTYYCKWGAIQSGLGTLIYLLNLSSSQTNKTQIDPMRFIFSLQFTGPSKCSLRFLKIALFAEILVQDIFLPVKHAQLLHSAII